MNQFSPVILCGSGRSGTTLLYKLLSLHRQVGFISNYDSQMKYGSYLQKLLGNLIDTTEFRMNYWFDNTGNAYTGKRPLLGKWRVIPHEGENLYKRCGMTLSVCDKAVEDRVKKSMRRKFKKMQRLKRSKVILTKRTAKNRRLPCIDHIFPEAKYIYLIRDGRSVAHSLVNVKWWGKHELWWSNFQSPDEIATSSEDMLKLAARNWIEESNLLEQGISEIPNERIFKVYYEQILINPIETLNSILSFVGIDSSGQFDNLIKSLPLKPREVEEWKRKWNSQELDAVQNIEKDLLSYFKYDIQ